MTSEVDICNLALLEVGNYQISSLSEQSKEAQSCNRLYEPTRDTILRIHKWNFATKRIVLASLPETFSGWQYTYQYPTDCHKAHEIYNPLSYNYQQTRDFDENQLSQSKKIAFEISADDGLTNRIILTNQVDAELIYTAKVTDPNMFDSLFKDALVSLLGSSLIRPLRADIKLQQLLYQKYSITMGEAKASNSNESHKNFNNSSSFMRSRF